MIVCRRIINVAATGERCGFMISTSTSSSLSKSPKAPPADVPLRNAGAADNQMQTTKLRNLAKQLTLMTNDAFLD